MATIKDERNHIRLRDGCYQLRVKRPSNTASLETQLTLAVLLLPYFSKSIEISSHHTLVMMFMIVFVTISTTACTF
jgi:hypothetical protein